MHSKLQCIFTTLCVLGDVLDELTAIVDGYSSYFSFSEVKSGYSGKIFVPSFLLILVL